MKISDVRCKVAIGIGGGGCVVELEYPKDDINITADFDEWSSILDDLFHDGALLPKEPGIYLFDGYAEGHPGGDEAYTYKGEFTKVTGNQGVNRTSTDDVGEVFETIPKCDLDQNRHDRALMLRALKRISVSPYNDFGGANNIALKAIYQVYG